MRTTMCARAAAAAVALFLPLAACSTSSPSSPGATEGDDGTTEITMGVLPIAPTAALQLGIDEGIFTNHGFDVTLQSGQGGAALLPAVVSGELQFAISNPLSVMLAQEQGIDVRTVSGYSHAKPTGEDVTSVWAKPGSGIEEPADLAGRTVAVNTLKTMGEVSIKGIVAAAGADPASVDIVELGFPDMPAALENGHIDAAWVPEPFQTTFKNEGDTLVAYNYQETFPGVPTMAVITSGQLAESDPDLVARFAAAVDEALVFAQENPEKVRETLTTFLEMEPELADQVVIEDFGSRMDTDALQSLVDLSLEYGVLSEPVDMAAFLPAD